MRSQRRGPAKGIRHAVKPFVGTVLLGVFFVEQGRDRRANRGTKSCRCPESPGVDWEVPPGFHEGPRHSDSLVSSILLARTLKCLPMRTHQLLLLNLLEEE